MKKFVPGLLACFFISLLVTQCQDPKRNVETSTDPGAKLFIQYCSRCHLSNGTGGQPVPGETMTAPNIRQFNKTAIELVPIIGHGYGKMPAFKDSVSNEDISLIAAYVANKIEMHVHP